MIFRMIGVFCIALLASGCTSLAKEGDYWRVSVAAPRHYEVWVVDMLLEAPGERSWREPVGTVGCCWAGPHGPSGKGGKADPFPELIGMRWFSFAEQKYYAKIIKVPKDLLDRMRELAPYKTEGDVRTGPRNTMTIGLAPGGLVVVWILNQVGNEIEVMRMRATEVSEDPDDFASLTANYLEQHGDYLEEHGVPTEGW
ncbi:DUF2931 family protein [Marinobacter panjinensis]|uniref:DUF2931 family protein n=1 Tax=Marinobacter panjinensis TaxID=2576384 RepID=A0A4U6R641_9GAMM|nr:DUF2931 family protein [Marinobacter panjinensis]MCR8913565.1 DUF2931 family protein [Marinobacter panjinensis]TKV67776.1 DUF2931 family protein [Marinobacter panjinensis]